MKEFLRNFKKQKTVGILNIFSLSLGIMVSVIVGLWAINELTFDRFHEKGDKMYRLVQRFNLNNQLVEAASSFKPLGEIAAAEIPEIEEMCRVVKETQGVTMNHIVHFGVVTLITDPNFFSFFSFPLKEGDINTVLAGPDHAVITESAAKKYFPDEDPIGKTITSHGYHFFISAIMYDMPRNSHIQAEIVFPLFGFFKNRQWDSGFYYDTYFIIPGHANLAAIEERLTSINRAGVGTYL